MKKIKKILFIFLVLILIIFASAYIDYYIVKTRNTTPRISVKEELNDNLIVYNAIMYRVWYCKTNNKYTIGDYKDSTAVCLSSDSYDENGNYINKNNILITKSDLEFISQYYSLEQISEMKQDDIDNAKIFINSYGKIQYKKLDTMEATQFKTTNNVDLVVFAEYVLNNNNTYELIYDDKVIYCMNEKGEIALYTNKLCGTYKKINVDSKICNLYEQTNLKDDIKIKKMCATINTTQESATKTK